MNFCLSLVHADGLPTMMVTHWCPSACCQCPPTSVLPSLISMPVAFFLSLVHACCFPSVAAVSLLPGARVCRRPCTCHQHLPVDCHLLSACAGGLQPVIYACRYPCACKQCVTVACHLSPACASGLPPVTGKRQWTAACCQLTPVACCLLPVCATCSWHAPVAYRLSPVHNGSLLPVTVTGWSPSACHPCMLVPLHL